MMWVSILAGALCGILSGFGIGGGSLLMVWMTAVLQMEQRTAQAINLLFFLPTAAASLIFHVKGKQVEWKASIPAMLAGIVTAALSAWLATTLATAPVPQARVIPLPRSQTRIRR